MVVAQGHEGLGVDNFYTGGKRDIARLFAHPHVALLRHDMRAVNAACGCTRARGLHVLAGRWRTGATAQAGR